MCEYLCGKNDRRSQRLGGPQVSSPGNTYHSEKVNKAQEAEYAFPGQEG
jgi:hypothetical protein